MSYSCLEELQVSLNLNLSDKTKILSDAGRKYNNNYWFIVTDDGNCHLFDNDGNLDDIAKVKCLDKNCVKRDIKKIIIPCNMMSIGSYALFNCSSLTSVTIPNSVTSIGDYAFSGCSKLTSIIIPGSVTNIENHAFYACNNLMSITIDNNIKSIENYIFLDCIKLTSVTIPDSVKSIGRFAFYNCNSLMSIIIPSSVTSIGHNAFIGCSNLNEIVFKGKTLAEVQSMKNYPWGIIDQSIMQAAE